MLPFLNYSCGILFSGLMFIYPSLSVSGNSSVLARAYTSLLKKIFTEVRESDVFTYYHLPPLECRLHDIVFSCSLYEEFLMDSEPTWWSLSQITFNVILLLNIAHIR